MRLTIGRKALLANTVIITALCGVLGWLLLRVQRMNEFATLAADAQEQVINIGALAQDTDELRRTWGTSLSILQAQSLGGLDTWREELRTRTTSLTSHRDSLLTVIEQSEFAQRPSMRQSLDRFRQASQDLFEGVFREVERRINLGMAEDAESMMSYWRVPARASQEALDQLTQQARSDAETLVEESTRFRSEFFTNALMAIGGTIVLALGTALALGRGIKRSTRELNDAMRAVAEGNLDHRVEASTRDEFRELADGFNAMSQRLGELDELKADFLSNVSHELRTPVASVKQSAQLLQDELLGPLLDEQQEIVEIIYGNSKRLSALINDLLDTAKLEAGRVDIYPQPIDLAETVNSVVKTVTPLASEKALNITLDTEPELPNVMADPIRIEQVLTNLLSNAIKFTPEEKSICVRCRRQGDMAACSVADTGVGIPPEELPYVFDKFHQVRATKTRKTKGTGLGLTIVRYLIESHAGHIDVESELGKGTTFTFTLPLQSGVPETERDSTI